MELLDRPLFIVGVPRSGTTWVQRLFLAQPGVCGGQESHFFVAFGQALRAYRDSSRSRRQAGLFWYWDEARFLEALRGLWRETMEKVAAAKPGSTLLVEKTPDHAEFLPEIRQVLPDARVIHVIRDSRAVVASLLAAGREDWGAHWAPKSLKDACWIYRLKLNKARAAGAVLGPSVYREVHYEDLMTHGVEELTALLKFAGMPANPEALAPILEKESFKEVSRRPAQAGQASRATLPNEPKGFFRSGRADSWKQELTLFQQLYVTLHTRRELRACGYRWNGGRIRTPIA